MFHPEWPEVIKYGSFGVFITEKFLRFYYQENYAKSIGGSSEDRKANDFTPNVTCLMEQQGSLVSSPTDLAYVRNNIFEIARTIHAIEMSLMAYNKQMEGKNKKTGLLLNSYGNKFINQFFISACQILCQSAPSQRHIDQANLIFMNCPHFHDAFNCKPGDKMKPDRICR